MPLYLVGFVHHRDRTQCFMYARQTLPTELHLQPIKEFLMSK